MPSALLLPVITCAAVLLLSGVAKLRAPATVDTAFTSLGVPGALDTQLVRRLFPWVEIALGAWLLLATGPALVVVALLTLALFLAYLVLVVRAVRRPEPVDCGCFGALGDSQVTTATVWRNAALVLSAALAVLAGLRGVGLLPSLLDDTTPLDDTGVWAWVAASALTATVAVLVTYRAPSAPGPAAVADAQVDESGDYVREAIPAAQVLTEDGRLVLVAHEARRGGHLLVFLSTGCSACSGIMPLVPVWSRELAPLSVRAVLTTHPSALESRAGELKGLAWFDPFSLTRLAFGCRTPSAVLVGTDGQIAGGPVHGDEDVRAFVAEVAEHLREAREAGELTQQVTDAR